MRLRIPPRRALAFAVGSVAACYFAFWACAPTSTMPPPVPLAEQPQAEIYVDNMAAAAWYSKYNVPQDGLRADFVSMNLNAAGGYSYGSGLSAGVFGHYSLFLDTDGGGSTSLSFGGGGYLRYLTTDFDRLALGFNLQAGWLHAGAGVPLSFRVGERAWVWTQPTLILEPGAGDPLCYRLPLGVSVVTRDRRAWTVQANLQRLGYMEITQVGIAVGVGQAIGPGYVTGGEDPTDLDDVYPKPGGDWSGPEEGSD